MFKDAFKHYKSKQSCPDLSQVLHISTPNSQIQLTKISINEPQHPNIFTGLKPIEDWNVYQILDKPGLIFIENPFSPQGQRYWITRCLKDFSCKPNKLNIDAHNYLETNENWWEICMKGPKRNLELINKLRWATLGYHHNWDTKIYTETSKDIFPEDLKYLCKYISEILGFKDFSAQAAIINYYHMNSTLSGHTDHSEQFLDAPLFSFSFGQSAIFLLGGLTENDPALPILINSGDIVVMSKESRLCYHAVPKIIPAPTEYWNLNTTEDEAEDDCWKPFNDYIKTSRLNMNVRQVLKPGQYALES